MGFDALANAMNGACVALLGTPQVYAPEGAPPVTVQGIFDNNYVDAKASTEHGFTITAPAVFFRLSDLPTDPRQDDPTITASNGTQYTIKSAQPDSAGGILLMLTKKVE